MDIESELKRIHERNLRVEADKAWETSWTRRGFISAATYVIAAVWLIVIHDTFPLLKAIVPVAGFILSTLSLPILKRAWIRDKYRSLFPELVEGSRAGVHSVKKSSRLRSGDNAAGPQVNILEGVVVKGNGEGSKLGFPTINIEASNNYPESGIFAGRVHFSNQGSAVGIHPKSYFAALYVPKHRNIIEAHLLDFSGDLYGVHVRIEILEKIRDVVSFVSNDEAKRAIAEDVKAVEKILFGGPDF
jgi:Riboflavin kinase